MSEQVRVEGEGRTAGKKQNTERFFSAAFLFSTKKKKSLHLTCVCNETKKIQYVNY